MENDENKEKVESTPAVADAPGAMGTEASSLMESSKGSTLIKDSRNQNLPESFKGCDLQIVNFNDPEKAKQGKDGGKQDNAPDAKDGGKQDNGPHTQDSGEKADEKHDAQKNEKNNAGQDKPENDNSENKPEPTVQKLKDNSTVTTTTTEQGKEVTGRDANGKQTFKVGFDAYGKPNSVKEGNGWDWTSKDGGKTWTAHNADGKPVDKDGNATNDPSKAQTWKGSVSVNEKGQLVQKSEGGTSYVRDADGTRTVSDSNGTQIDKPNGTTTWLNDKGERTRERDKDGKDTVYWNDNGKEKSAPMDAYQKEVHQLLTQATNAITSDINKSNNLPTMIPMGIAESTLRMLTAFQWDGTGISQHHNWQKDIPARANVSVGFNADKVTPKDWEAAFKEVQGHLDQLNRKWGNCGEQAANLAHVFMNSIKTNPGLAGLEVRQANSGVGGSHSWVEVKYPNGDIKIYDHWGQKSGSPAELKNSDLGKYYNDPNRTYTKWFGKKG